jgi:hypothetical protein
MKSFQFILLAKLKKSLDNPYFPLYIQTVMKKASQLSQLDLYKEVRKALAPPPRPHKNKKKYNRRDFK